jgi:hypothetical protein
MHQHLKKTIIFIGFVVFPGFFMPAHAYVLQGPHILRLMAQKLGKPKSLLVYQKLILKDNDSPGDPVEFKETVRYLFSKTFRSDISSEELERIYVITEGEVLKVIDGKATSESENGFDRYKDLLLYRHRKLLEEKLPAFGVDVTVSSFGRFQGKPVYVVGARYPDKTVPQVWVDKDTFRPLRWIVTAGNSGNDKASLEIRYLEWWKKGKTWYPRRIEFYHNEILMREIQVDNIIVNPHFSERLFDIGHLESIYRPEPLVTDQQKPEDPSEVQKTIDEFKKKYE